MGEHLSGGNTNPEVIRVGSTVRRRTGPWTPAVHALLRHLEARGFEGAPRVRGIDDEGREVLTYIEGIVVWPDHFDLVRDTEPLAAISRLIRRYHDLVADFPMEDSFAWSDLGRDPTRSAEVVCHNDLAPWNLIRADDRWTFIDWDTAAPGRRSWDLAWAVASLVPLMPDSALPIEQTRRRISVFREGYGLDLFPDDVLDVAAERCGTEAERIRVLGSAGRQPYERLLSDGHADVWANAEKHIRRLTPAWRSASSR